METLNIKQVAAITNLSKHRIYRLVQSLGDDLLDLERGACNAVVFTTESLTKLLDADRLLRVEKLSKDEVRQILAHPSQNSTQAQTDAAELVPQSGETGLTELRATFDMVARAAGSIKTMSRTIFDELLHAQKKIDLQQGKIDDLSAQLETAKAQNEMVLSDLTRIRAQNEKVAEMIEKMNCDMKNRKSFMSRITDMLFSPFGGHTAVAEQA